MGCVVLGANACDADTGPGQPLEFIGAVQVGDTLRTYEAYVPAYDDVGDGLPLIVALHGAHSTGAVMRRISGFDELADELGFAVAYPDALDVFWAEDCGCVDADLLGVNDTGFVRTLVDTLAIRLPIDRRRLYAAGFSQGAFFAYRLGCQMSDLFAATGSVAGPMSVPLSEHCIAENPIAVLGFQGTGDSTFPPQGGGQGIFAFLGARATVELWASHNDCATEPESEALPDTADDNTTVTRDLYAPCAAGSEVELYLVEGGTHGWGISRDVSTARVLSEFFLRHAKDGL
jgi:polyhydroxybutyrate depolymerase